MRIILCANSTSRLIAPIKSRCLLMRVAAPNAEDVGLVLSGVGPALMIPYDRCKRLCNMCQSVLDLTYLQTSPGRLLMTLVEISARLYYALKPSKCSRESPSQDKCLQSVLLTSCIRPDLSGALTIAKPDWETYCHKVADLIISQQSPARVMEVRQKFYELLSHCIPPTIILKVRLKASIFSDSSLISNQTVADRVVERVDEAIKADVMHWAAVYVSNIHTLYRPCVYTICL